MNKINYDILMNEELKKIGENSGKKILLHSCCAPCSCAILEFLRKYMDISIYFYNPNITDKKEYVQRLNEQYEYDRKLNYNMGILEGEYEPIKDFMEKVKGLEKEPEGGKRCFKCYYLRMEATAKKANELGYDYFGTVLSISPLKNAQWINEIGKELEEKYNIKYFYADFKKKNRYKRGVELSKEHTLYRQDYCGCVFSKIERMEKLNEKQQ